MLDGVTGLRYVASREMGRPVLQGDESTDTWVCYCSCTQVLRGQQHDTVGWQLLTLYSSAFRLS